MILIVLIVILIVIDDDRDKPDLNDIFVSAEENDIEIDCKFAIVALKSEWNQTLAKKTF